MSNKRDLKAYVRYDGTGRVIPGSLILQRNKPKVGNWIETPAYECCNYLPGCVLFSINSDYLYIEGGVLNDSGVDVIMTVNWGDGNTESLTLPAGTQSYLEHEYSSVGAYNGTVCFSEPNRVNVFYIDL
tara:strand:+ start:621 stop:1007 length:387 start_codon:yes stop_codon:yes gene_type:complete